MPPRIGTCFKLFSLTHKFIEISDKITHPLNHSHHTLPLQYRLTRTASEFLISAKKRLVNQEFAHKNNGRLSHTRSNQTSLFENRRQTGLNRFRDVTPS